MSTPTGIIEYTENMVGKGHPTLTDTLNRGFLVRHNDDGTHKAGFAEYTTTATAAGTTTLTATSTYFQFFTGTTTQTVVLPVVTTLTAGTTFCIVNNSTGTITVNSSGGNLVTAVPSLTATEVVCILITGTTAASWSSLNCTIPASAVTGTTLASSVVTSSLTTVGALNAGSITSGFGAIDIGTDNITAGNATFNGTGAVKVSTGTTAERPADAAGLIRYNSTTTVFEGNSGTGWTDFSAGNPTTTSMGTLINSAGAATPNDTDLVATAENAGLLKKITWTNVKAFLKTYLDTLYAPKNGSASNAFATAALTPTSFVGVTTNSDAPAGAVGEYLTTGRVVNDGNLSSDVWADAGSLSLTAGDWDITFTAEFSGNGVSRVLYGISTTSGNSQTGMTGGVNLFDAEVPVVARNTSATLPSYRCSIASTTVYYGKVNITFSTTGISRSVLHARRVR